MLINFPFFSSEHKLSQFVIKSRDDKSNDQHVSHYMVSCGDFIGLCWNPKNKSNVSATSCIEIVVNHTTKKFHCYPTIKVLPKKFTEFFSYYSERLTRQNVSLLKRFKSTKANHEKLLSFYNDNFGKLPTILLYLLMPLLTNINGT